MSTVRLGPTVAVPVEAGGVPAESSPAGEWRAGWRVACAASAGFGLTFPLFVMTSGLFIAPMQAEFGWSRTALAIGPMITLLSAPMNPVAGMAVGRFGARRVGITGVLLLAAGILSLAAIPASPLLLYALVVCFAVVGPLTSAPTYTAGVVSWFSRSAGSAIGITMGGISITSIVVLPLLIHVIGEYGWRVGYHALAALMLLALVPIALWFRERSGQESVRGQASESPVAGSTVRMAVADRRFWLMTLAISLVALAVGGYMSQLVPLLTSRNFNLTAVSVLASVFALSIGIGRIGTGVLLDRLPPALVTTTCLGAPAIGAGLLAAGGLGPDVGAVAVVVVGLIGLAQGAGVNFLAFYALKLFGRKSYSVIFGILLTVNSCVTALGGLIFAGLFDHFGNYQVALYLSAAMYLAASALMLTIRLPASAGMSARIGAASPARCHREGTV